MTNLDVVTLGEAMLLLVADDGLPLQDTALFRRSIAGAESNVAIGLARLGHRTGWLGRVGDDPFGHGVLRTLRGEGVDVSRARMDPTAPTGVIVRDRHPDRPVQVAYYRTGSAGSRLDPSDVEPAWLTNARILHITGITAALSDSAARALNKAVTLAAEAGLTISFDPNIRYKLAPADRWEHLLRPLAARSHIVLASLAEALLISGRNEVAAAGEWFLEQGAHCVVIKEGRHGAWAADATSQHHCPTASITAVDPIGAGDAFAAGFLSARLRGLSLDHALREASAVAAAAVGAPGDINGLPTACQRDAILASTEARR